MWIKNVWNHIKLAVSENKQCVFTSDYVVSAVFLDLGVPPYLSNRKGDNPTCKHAELAPKLAVTIEAHTHSSLST